MKQFNINKGATLPYLEVVPVNDGRNGFRKLCYAIQTADVYFSMTDVETGIKKISNARAEIVYQEGGDCVDRFKIRYKWNKRDTNTVGRFKATFRIVFGNAPAVEGMDFPDGELLVPIQEDIIVCVNS